MKGQKNLILIHITKRPSFPNILIICKDPGPPRGTDIPKAVVYMANTIMLCATHRLDSLSLLSPQTNKQLLPRQQRSASVRKWMSDYRLWAGAGVGWGWGLSKLQQAGSDQNWTNVLTAKPKSPLFLTVPIMTSLSTKLWAETKYTLNRSCVLMCITYNLSQRESCQDIKDKQFHKLKWHISKFEGRNHRIISIKAEKVFFDRVQHLFMI